MLARHAESLFWAGRYLERAEDTARVLDVAYHGSLQVAVDESRDAWAAVLDVVQARAAFDVGGQRADEEAVCNFLAIDRRYPGSIVSSIAAARENFRTVREYLPTEMWETVNRFHLELGTRDLRTELAGEPYALFDMVKVRCQTLGGVAAQSMPRDEVYSFLRLGWMIERAVITCRLIEVTYPTLSFDDYDALLNTLRSGAGLEAYRRLFQSSTNPAHVVAFLLQSSAFPRSVLFCLQRAEHSLSNISSGGGGRNRARRLLGRIRSELEFADLTELSSDQLCAWLAALQLQLFEFADLVAAQYFRVGDDFAMHAQYVLPGEVPT